MRPRDWRPAVALRERERRGKSSKGWAKPKGRFVRPQGARFKSQAGKHDFAS